MTASAIRGEGFMEPFWQGFQKRANELRNPAVLAESESSAAEAATPGGQADKREEKEVLKNSVSASGPRLAALTEESDRGKHEAFKG